MLSTQDKQILINSIQILNSLDKDILYNTILQFNDIVAKYVSQYELNEDMMKLLIEQQRWALGRSISNKEVAEIMTRVLNFIKIG